MMRKSLCKLEITIFISNSLRWKMINKFFFDPEVGEKNGYKSMSTHGKRLFLA